MTLDVYRGGRRTAQEERPAYIFEMRDIHFVLSYILCTCGGSINDFVIVVIHRIQVAGLCNASNAAERLFLRPLYPLLNGVLRAIKCSGSVYAFPSPGLPFNPNAFGLYNRRTFARRVMVDIIEAMNTYDSQRSTPFSRWDIRPALRIWNERLDCLKVFATLGRWTYNDHEADHGSVWEVTALRTLDEIQSQRIRANHPVLGTGMGPCKAELLQVYREAMFFVGVGYLNLSYLPQTLFAQGLLWQDVLTSSQPSPVQRTPTSLVTQANAHLLRIPILSESTLLTDIGTYDALIFKVCSLLTIAETELIISTESIHHVWKNLFMVFKLLSPGYSETKLGRLAMRLRLRLARQLWSNFVIETMVDGTGDDGHLRGMWFRHEISKNMVKELMERELGQESIGEYGEAVFGHIPLWVAGRYLDGWEKILRKSKGCCRGSHG